MALKIEYTGQFKKDLKKAKKQGKDLGLLHSVLSKIEQQEVLPAKLRDHKLAGNLNHYRELHIENDWLLIYRLIPEKKMAILVRVGSHSELFD